MLSEDIVLDNATVWRSVVCTGDQIHIMSGMDEVDVLVRFGIGSNAGGIILTPGDTLSAAETVYVKPLLKPMQQYQHTTINVIR